MNRCRFESDDLDTEVRNARAYMILRSKTLTPFEDLVVADVKCYYCGHISGQISGQRGANLANSRFIPRPGYRGPEIKPGFRIRCERCRGPVFLEDATPMMRAEGALARKLGINKDEAKKRRAA